MSKLRKGIPVGTALALGATGVAGLWAGSKAVGWAQRRAEYDKAAEGWNARNPKGDLHPMGLSAFLHIPLGQLVGHATDQVFDPTSIGSAPSLEQIKRKLFRASVFNHEHALVLNSMGTVIDSSVGEGDHVGHRLVTQGGFSFHNHPVDAPPSAMDIQTAARMPSAHHAVIGYGQHSDGSVIENFREYSGKTKKMPWDHTDQGVTAFGTRLSAPSSPGPSDSEHPHRGKGKGGGQFMRKRAAGAPLSQAEHQQRVDAARARWRDRDTTAAIGATVAAGAGALAGIGAHLRLRGIEHAAAAQIEAGHQHVQTMDRAVKKTAEDYWAEFGRNEDAITKGKGSKAWLLAVKRQVKARAEREGAAAAALAALHSQPILVEGGETIMALPFTTDAHGNDVPHPAGAEIRTHNANRRRLSAQFMNLELYGKPDSRVRVKAGTAAAVAASEQVRRGKPVPRWKPGAETHLAALRQAVGLDGNAEKATLPAVAARQVEIWKTQPGRIEEVREVLRGVTKLSDLNRDLMAMPARARENFLDENALPEMKLIRPRQVVQIPAHERVAAKAHTMKLEGYPAPEVRNRLVRELQADLREQAVRWDDRHEVDVARVRLARIQTSIANFGARRRLEILRNPKIRGFAAGVATAAVGLGAAAALKGAQIIWERVSHPTLDKAAGADELAKARPRKPRSELLGDAEAATAQRLAQALGSMKEMAAAKLAQPDGVSIHQAMLTGFEEALKPLDRAVLAGVTEPVTVTAPEHEGGHQVAFSMKARSPFVVSYVNAQREDRAAELADEQRETIKGNLIAAAKAGASPDVMARTIRETVGLTASQGEHVKNYRVELELLHPGALKRALRDRRFDEPVKRAIEDGTPLKAAAIDRYVDAYHRRYLAHRATTIARTEGVGGANNGQMAAARELLAAHPGFIAIKRWHAKRDDATRHDHAELDGTEVEGLDTPFVCDSGDEICFPHDPRAAARQTINCRCTCSIRIVPGPDLEDPDMLKLFEPLDPVAPATGTIPQAGRFRGVLQAHPLAKGMNTTPVPDGSPLLNTPRRATADLLRQANKKIGKGQGRKKIYDQLRTSTARRAAVVTPAAPAATAAGSGGGGFSGRVASRLGAASNPGTVTPTPPRPPPVR